jgi:hypothetical protein
MTLTIALMLIAGGMGCGYILLDADKDARAQ